MNGELEVRRFEVNDDGESLNVTLEIHNRSNRTVYVYREIRGVKYDAGSKTLRLSLSDRYLVEDIPMFIKPQPALTPIDPGQSETLKLRAPRIVTQLGPEVSGRPGPTLQESHVHEAQAIEVEISWSDKPFYQEPGEKRSHAEQVRRWERGLIEARVDRRTGQVTPPSSGGPTQQLK